MFIEMYVPLKRGGKIPMLVKGSFSEDTLGSGQAIQLVEIEHVSFLNYPEKNMLHIVDIEALEEDFRDEALKIQRGYK